MRSLCQQECFWIDFGEVFGEVFWYNFDTFLYYSAYRAGKDLGRDLENKFFKFGMILDCFFEWFGRSCWHDFVIPLYIIYIGLLTVFVSGICRDILMVLWTGQKVPLIWWYFSQIVFVQCDADVSIILRSRCQNECEPMSRRMRSRCQD